jgi:hypothetical protein
MKKIFYSFAILSLLFTSCNPLEDIYNELDAKENVISGEVKITLADADYTNKIAKGGLGLSFPNFNSLDNAKEVLPTFLSSKYPVWGKESLAGVTFKLYAPRRDEKSLTIYTVTSKDYSDNGHSYGNFDSFTDISEFLDVKYPSAANRLLVSLTYKYYDGAQTLTLEDGFINNAGTWEKSTGITDDEYSAMGEGRAQFSFKDEALAKIPVFAKNRFQYESKEAGDVEGIMYKLYVTDTQDVDGDGRIDDKTVYRFVTFVVYDGANWSLYNNIVNETIKFGHDGTSWVPDNTIKRTLSPSDIAFISNQFITKYPGPADNLGFFKSFDVRSSSSNYWNDDMLLEAFNALLNDINPSAEEGQKYSLTYVVYNGSTVNYTINVIKDGVDYRIQTADD